MHVRYGYGSLDALNPIQVNPVLATARIATDIRQYQSCVRMNRSIYSCAKRMRFATAT